MANFLNRRAMLGSMAVAPAILATASLPRLALAASPVGNAIFNERLAAFERANAEFLSACRTSGLPDEVGSEACRVAGDAYDAMIATPAPDFPSLGKKLDALARWSSGSEIPNGEIEMLAADARRLVGKEG